MKILLGQGILVFLSAIILYYLLHAPTFLPYTDSGVINWENVIVLIFFSSVVLLNLVSIFFVLINKFFLRKPLTKELFYTSLKLGTLITLGIITVFTLNFLHILNIYYGLGVLLIVLVTFFVI
jgi:hypothetical protein